MVADLREMQENQWVSEIRIDKFRFVFIIVPLLTGVVNYLALKREKGTSLRSASLGSSPFQLVKKVHTGLF